MDSEPTVGINVTRGVRSVSLNATIPDADGRERTVALGTIDAKVLSDGVDVVLAIPDGARMVSVTANDRGTLTHFAFAADTGNRK